jgi:hypothetical protein
MSVANNIERLEVTAGRLGIGVSKFRDEFVDWDNGVAVVPGTKIRRLRPVLMGPKSIGFLSDETDALIEALRRHRDSAPQAARAEPEHLRTGRDAYWKRRRKRDRDKRRETAAERVTAP